MWNNKVTHIAYDNRTSSGADIALLLDRHSITDIITRHNKQIPTPYTFLIGNSINLHNIGKTTQRDVRNSTRKTYTQKMFLSKLFVNKSAFDREKQTSVILTDEWNEYLSKIITTCKRYRSNKIILIRHHFTIRYVFGISFQTSLRFNSPTYTWFIQTNHSS